MTDRQTIFSYLLAGFDVDTIVDRTGATQAEVERILHIIESMEQLDD